MNHISLSGVRVVDFSRLLPGPYASLWLADQGADVIKVEGTRGGDYLRWMPPLSGGTSCAFDALNAGKRSVAVDLKHPSGKALALALMKRADVVIESFRPGVMDRLGLGYGQLSAVNPRLVYCAISGYGQMGPYRDTAGHDLNYLALSGALGMTGPAGQPPGLSGVQIADIGGGSLWALVGIMGALFTRERSGSGQLLDISMTDGALGFLQSSIAATLAGDRAAQPRGLDTLTGGQACYAVYETSDGKYMALAALEPKFWRAFCERVQRPDLVDKQYGSPALIEKTRLELVALFKTKTRSKWQALLEGSESCCEPVLEPGELMNHPLHRARGNVVSDERGALRLRTPLSPVEGHSKPGPGLGQHTAEVLAELGYSPHEVGAMVEEGVVVAPGHPAEES